MWLVERGAPHANDPDYEKYALQKLNSMAVTRHIAHEDWEEMVPTSVPKSSSAQAGGVLQPWVNKH